MVPGAGEGVGTDGVGVLRQLGQGRPGSRVPGPVGRYGGQALAPLARFGLRSFSEGGRGLGACRWEDRLGGRLAQGDFGHTARQRNLAFTEGCIFDKVACGELLAHLVLEEDEFVAFLDHLPVFDGHTLVVPRAHYGTLAELPTELLAPLLDAGRRVGAAQRAVLGAEGTFFALNEVVSQSVPHVHLHVVPRRFGDGLRGFLWPRHRYQSDDAAAELAARLRGALAALDRTA